jgi:aryl-alcohol dehydrogenase-like predicted oxidoreductase
LTTLTHLRSPLGRRTTFQSTPVRAAGSSSASAHYDEHDVVEAVHRGLELGVTLFDTARAYGFGRSEELLGRALGGRRQEVVLVTKIGLEKGADGTYYRDSSKETLLRGFEHSLRALRTEFVDLLLIHWPDRARPWEEPMETLAEIQRSGKARYVGVSNFRAADLSACARLADIVTNQVGYNLFDRRWEREMFPTAERLGIGIMAYGPLAHGLLTGTFTPATTFQSTDWRSSGGAFGQPLLSLWRTCPPTSGWWSGCGRSRPRPASACRSWPSPGSCNSQT